MHKDFTPKFESLEERVLLSATVIEELDQASISVPAEQNSVIQEKNTEILIIDTSVDNYEDLIASLDKPSLEIHFLDANDDGVKQISQILENYDNLDSLHIVSHGEAGVLQLGNSELSSSTFSSYTDSISTWSESFSQSADILLYGCNVGQDSSFIEQLANLTQADIAASDDLTGANNLGGDNQLELHEGTVETQELFSNEQLSKLHDVLAITGNNNDTWTFANDGIQEGSLPSQGDAFDGNQKVRVGGVTFSSSFTESGLDVSYQNLTLANLDVDLKRTVLSDSATVRTFVTLTNNTATSITTTFELYGNLGSDGNTSIKASSSGDLSYSTADHWLVTDDSGTTSGDPALIHVNSGVGATVSAKTQSLSRDNLSTVFDVTIGAGESVSFLSFVQMHSTSSGAISAANLLNIADLTTTTLLAGLSTQEITQIVNFSLSTNEAPVASFTRTGDLTEGQVQSFDGSSSTDSDGSVANYEWDFDNDGVFDATGVNANHTFTQYGSHTVTLRVTDDQGASHTSSHTFNLANVSPSAVDDSATIDEENSSFVTGNVLTNDSDVGSLTVASKIVSGAYGQIVLQTDGSYTYTLDQQSTALQNLADGTVVTETFSYEVSDGLEIRTANILVSITAHNNSPLANFVISGPVKEGVNLTFDANTSFDSDGSIISYEWDFDNDGVFEATGSTIDHVFTVGGIKTVSLKVTDNLGSTSVSTHNISVGRSLDFDALFRGQNASLEEDIKAAYNYAINGDTIFFNTSVIIKLDSQIDTDKAVNLKANDGVSVIFDGQHKTRILSYSLLQKQDILIEGNINFHKGSTVDTFVKVDINADKTISLDDNSGNYYSVTDYLSETDELEKSKFQAFFSDQYASYHGGALSVNNANLILEDVSFQSSFAYGNGGAVYHTNGDLTVRNSSFFYNEAFKTTSDAYSRTYGGALYSSSSQTSNVTIDSSIFNYNSLKTVSEDKTALSHGGSIYIESTQATVQNSFINNSKMTTYGYDGAYSWGGALYVVSDSAQYINNVFETNSSSSSSFKGYSYTDGVALMSVVDSVELLGNDFYSNTASSLTNQGWARSSGVSFKLSGESALVSENKLIENNASSEALVASYPNGSGTSFTSSAVYGVAGHINVSDVKFFNNLVAQNSSDTSQSNSNSKLEFGILYFESSSSSEDIDLDLSYNTVVENTRSTAASDHSTGFYFKAFSNQSTNVKLHSNIVVGTSSSDKVFETNKAGLQIVGSNNIFGFTDDFDISLSTDTLNNIYDLQLELVVDDQGKLLYAKPVDSRLVDKGGSYEINLGDETFKTDL